MTTYMQVWDLGAHIPQSKKIVIGKKRGVTKTRRSNGDNKIGNASMPPTQICATIAPKSSTAD